MDWKDFRALEPKEKRDEAYYLIGIDVGNDSSAIAFFNMSTNAPETIDLSGGYGKPSIPTAVQYIADTKEWVFGEYAILNQSSGEVFTSLMGRMGNFEHVSIDGKPMRVAHILGLFVKELLGSVRNINPKAVIAGIIANVPTYFSEEAGEEFKEVFDSAGYREELIALVPDRECILARHYRVLPGKEERVLILDFGHRELRGGLYKVSSENNCICAKSLSSFFDESISMESVDKEVGILFDKLFSEVSENAGTDLPEQLAAFTFQHKDLLFQKNIRAKPIKLYFNFAYPPVQATVGREIVDTLVKPYSAGFNRFVSDVLRKNIEGRQTSLSDINSSICVGGGFEMLWAREAVESLFSAGKTSFVKSPKLVNAEGAALIAAREAGLDIPIIKLEDNHQLTSDFGFVDKGLFIPLALRNSFWWQKHLPKLFIVNAPVDGEIELMIGGRTDQSTIRELHKISLNGLPVRPKGVTRLLAELSFASHTDMTLSISDKGFGDLFPKTDYQRLFEIKLNEVLS